MSSDSASSRLTVAFAMLADKGHYTGTFRLARELRARGHRVVYIGLACSRELVEAQEFEFVAFAEDLVPAGHVRQLEDAGTQPVRGLLRTWRKRRSDEQLFAEYLRRIEDGLLDECLRACGPDILLCDTFLWYVALRALRLRIPTVSISVILSLYPNARIPPILSSMRPGATWWSALCVLSSWAWLRLRFLFTKRLASKLLGTYRSPTRMHHLVDVFIRIAKRSGYRCRENETYWFGEMGPRLALPELVLCPEAFQLAGKPADGRRYVGDYVDLDRTEEPIPPEIGAGTKPLVYCSMGTCAFLYPHRRRFIQAVVGASRLREDWQFVLQVSDQRLLEQIEAAPNLLARKWVPQIALLRRTSVMVTHGGLNSIMECVQLGVPMVVVPAMRDQPGNSVRAVHHRLALVTDMAGLTAECLVALVARAMADAGIRSGLATMKQAIDEEGGMANALHFVEAYGTALEVS